MNTTDARTAKSIDLLTTLREQLAQPGHRCCRCSAP